MAANQHIDGYIVTNQIFEFNRAAGHLNIFVGSGVTFSISFDGGVNFLTVPAGLTQTPIGPVNNVIITSSGTWQIVGSQA